MLGSPEGGGGRGGGGGWGGGGVGGGGVCGGGGGVKREFFLPYFPQEKPIFQPGSEGRLGWREAIAVLIDPKKRKCISHAGYTRFWSANVNEKEKRDLGKGSEKRVKLPGFDGGVRSACCFGREK